MNHIDYIVQRAGGARGIGTDFNHGGGMRGFDEASDAPNITAALLARGYSPDEIDKMFEDHPEDRFVDWYDGPPR
jgi:membrane dipeptidase